MSLTSDIIRGHTETIILCQLRAGDSYGYQINKNIKEKTQGQYEVKEATLYTAFRRLEESGFIRAYWGDEGAGARRKYYAITPEGQTALSENMAEWQRVKGVIDSLISA
jgi:DNA-binding PadR family transcriptional regulator